MLIRLLSSSAVVCLALALAVSAGCSHDTDLHVLPNDAGAASDADAAAIEAGPRISVTTFAPARTSAPAARASATWAAYRLDEGPWRAVAASAVGSYELPLPEARWAIALACASDDDSTSTVFVHHRTNATPKVEVTLDDNCTPPPPAAEFAFTGKLANLPTTTQWFDFGYARDSRGEVIPVMGTTGTYEVVGIEPGTWDVAFGVRDESFRSITRFVMRRGEAVSADKVIDLDVAGPGSFVPGTQSIRLRGLVKGDTVTPTVYYAAGGPFGIDVGPQDVPDGQPDVTLGYSTVPASAQLAGDRYRGQLSAVQDRRTGGRTITFDIHQALDLDFTFLPEAPVPTVTVVGTAPYARFETKLPIAANAERHEVTAVAMLNRRTQHAFRSTYDAIYLGSATELVDTTPDLSSLPGWKAAWGLSPDVTSSVLAAVYEKTQALGDGTMQRATSKSVDVTP